MSDRVTQIAKSTGISSTIVEAILRAADAWDREHADGWPSEAQIKRAATAIAEAEHNWTGSQSFNAAPQVQHYEAARAALHTIHPPPGRLAVMTEPISPNGLEPKGCPTPGMCSCPVASKDTLDRLDRIEAALREVGRRWQKNDGTHEHYVGGYERSSLAALARLGEKRA